MNRNAPKLPSCNYLFAQIWNRRVGTVNLYVAVYTSTSLATHRNTMLTVFPGPVWCFENLRTSQV